MEFDQTLNKHLGLSAFHHGLYHESLQELEHPEVQDYIIKIEVAIKSMLTLIPKPSKAVYSHVVKFGFPIAPAVRKNQPIFR